MEQKEQSDNSEVQQSVGVSVQALAREDLQEISLTSKFLQARVM